METTDALLGLDCRECGSRFDPFTNGPCPECGGILDPTYEYDAIELSRSAIERRPFDSMWRYAELLPFSRADAVTLNEGATPLVACPRLADSMGVSSVLIKDEGRNPTGTFKDRGHSPAVTAAQGAGITDIALSSAGNAGQSASAYAARAGLDAHVFLPSRAGFTQKAMVNVHGADLTVVDGRLDHAGAAFRDALVAHENWRSTATFDTPYRHDGKKTMGFELIEQLGWEVPDAVVYPTGGGVGLIGIHKAATELLSLGLIDDRPAMYAAQSTGCAPIVEAWESGSADAGPWETPDTICGGIEVPDPGAASWVLEAIRESDGGAVATTDADVLESAAVVAREEGLEMGATPAAAASGAWALSERGVFDQDATVVIINTGAGNKDADIIRSHLMGQGV